jgi:hypothetical protein
MAARRLAPALAVALALIAPAASGAAIRTSPPAATHRGFHAPASPKC